jgi:hypothetical protein
MHSTTDVCDLIRESKPHSHITHYAVSLLYTGKRVPQSKFPLGITLFN